MKKTNNDELRNSLKNPDISKRQETESSVIRKRLATAGVRPNTIITSIDSHKKTVVDKEREVERNLSKAYKVKIEKI